MKFNSILFLKSEDSKIEDTLEAPAFFIDLNLDQIIDAIVAGKWDYNLKPFFYFPVKDSDTIKYRQEIVKDLENRILLDTIKSFAQKMVIMRRYLAMCKKLTYKYHLEGWFLETVIVYCDAVNSLAQELSQIDLHSQGLRDFREFLSNYAGSEKFTTLAAETKSLKSDLSSIKYSIITKGNFVRVRKYDSEIDYSLEVLKTFEKFKQGAVKDYTQYLTVSAGMNHVQAQVLDLVAKLNPEIFKNLNNYYTKYRDFCDETICRFDREIQFYVAYIEYMERFKKAGLHFCFPLITQQSKEIYNYEGFDLALANKCISENLTIVPNDFHLKDKERIIIVSGPNQGGKTTFARVFGQLHYLANLGLPVPGIKAQLFLFDNLFTHFEKEEDIRNLRGKLQDDLVRIYNILNQATSNSIIIMNEIFTSTSLKDAVYLSKIVIEKIIQLDLLCVCVSFIDELALLSEKTISMVSTVVPENPTVRTYKIIRKPPDGLAYAIHIAEKYRLTYELLKERIKS